jgi:hypothetical protein
MKHVYRSYFSISSRYLMAAYPSRSTVPFFMVSPMYQRAVSTACTLVYDAYLALNNKVRQSSSPAMHAKLLRVFQPKESPASEFWWTTTGIYFQRMLEWAAYPPYLQRIYTSFYLRSIVPEFGSAPMLEDSIPRFVRPSPPYSFLLRLTLLGRSPT